VGFANGKEVVKFSLPFKAKPIVICTGGLKVKSEDISKISVLFSGTTGSYEIIGE